MTIAKYVGTVVISDRKHSECGGRQDEHLGEAQTDWSTICEFFNNPFVLAAYELPPTVYNLANSAVKEMRRYYSRKVLDVLIKVTRQSIDALRKKFSQETGNSIK